MRKLPEPINGTELYLAAIHDRLGEILERLDGGHAPVADQIATALREHDRAEAALLRFTPSIPAAEPATVAPAESQPAESPTRRTRTRTRAGGGSQ